MTSIFRTHLVFAVLLFTTIAASAAPPPIVTTPDAQFIPVLHLTTTNDKPFDLAAQRGKWVLVYFWATWCPPCTAGMPAISQFIGTHHDVTAIGLATARVQPDRGKVAEYAKSHMLGFPLAWLDAQQSAQLGGNLDAIPITWLIAPDGTRVQTWTGGFNAPQLQKLMRGAGYHTAATH